MNCSAQLNVRGASSPGSTASNADGCHWLKGPFRKKKWVAVREVFSDGLSSVKVMRRG